MALQDLIISQQKISQELLEGLLKGNIDLIQDGRKVALTKKGMSFSNRIRILLFLAGGKAWELLDKESWVSSPGEMEELLAITGNTLRPVLKELADNFLVKSEKGKYRILPKGIFELEKMIQQGEKNENEHLKIYTKKSNKNQLKKAGGSPSKSKAFEELIKEGFFSTARDLNEIQVELGRRGVPIKTTSLPSFLLPLIRKKALTRDYKDRGKRKIWVYKINAKNE